MLDLLQQLSSHPFYEFALILLAAAILGGIGQLFRQPIIVMFIVLGIVLGPSLLDIVKSKDQISLLAEIGISVLLFIVGLKLDVRIIKSVGKIALLTGLGQVIFTSLIGYFIGLALGFSALHSFYIAVALTFSSTIIIVKLLSDKKEIDSLHGQIAVGFLIVQDIVVILVMIVLAAIGKEGGGSLFEYLMQTLLSGGVLVAATYIAMRFVIPGLSQYLARSQEMLTLFAIAWALTLASVGELMGFSGEVGAFLAGVSLASSSFKDSVSSRLVSLRDFLLLFFFVKLGAELDLASVGDQVGSALIFSAFVLIGNPIIVLIIMGAMGYRKRTSFLAGLTVAQISEFSLIFAGLGLSVGHITEQTVGLITLVGLITIGLSTYLIIYAHPIYEKIAPLLSIFERKKPYNEPESIVTESSKADIIIFGLGRFGSRLIKMLDNHPDVTYYGVDFDPNVVKAYRDDRRPVLYGDVEDPELIDHLPIRDSRCVISTIPDLDHAAHLMQTLHRENYQGKVFLTTKQEKDKIKLTEMGADRVIFIHELAADRFYDDMLKPLLT